MTDLLSWLTKPETSGLLLKVLLLLMLLFLLAKRISVRKRLSII